MTLVDANILLYATDQSSSFHGAAKSWLTEQLNGPVRVGLPWQCLTAFLRISTHPRASRNPLDSDTALAIMRDWLSADPTWVPEPGPGHAEILSTLITKYQLRGNLISDARLAALAIEHGLTVCSVDTDFARFSELRWSDPTR